MKRTVWIENDRRVRWYDPVTDEKDGHTCADKAAAKLFEAEKVLWLEKWKPGAVDPTVAPLVVLSEHLTEMATENGCRKQSLKTRRVVIEDFIKRQTVVNMGAFTNATVKAWVTAMQDRGNRAKTIRHNLIELRAFKNFAVKRKYLGADPMDGIAIPPDPRRKGKRFTPKERTDLIAGAPDWFRPYIIVCMSAGGRLGDMLQMEWRDVDTEHWIWNIPGWKAKVDVDRRIPLEEPARTALRSILGGKDPASASGLVFPWKPGKVYRGWRAAKIAANITLAPHEARPHDMRHTFAASLGRGRWPSLKALGGWKTDAMAAHYAGGMTDEELREDVKRFGVDLGEIDQKRGKSGG